MIDTLYKYAGSIACSIALCGLISGCTDSFEGYNTNKHEATEEMMSYDNLKTGSFFSQMLRNVVPFDDGINLSSTYQIAQGLSADLYSGYVAPTGAWYAGVHNGSYSFVSNWINAMFELPFTSVMPAWESIVTIADEQNLPEVAALATVVKVAAMHRVADTYGPIPYINFGSGNLQNNYDSLDEIYAKFFEELGDAIEELTAFVNSNPGTKLLQSFDYVYEGDVEKWVKFANTLRLRLAMRVVYADAALAKREAESAVDNPIGLITNTGERASLKHASLNYYHPLIDIQEFNAGEARMSAIMDAYMNGYADPRRAAYFTAASDDGYHGVRLGIVSSTWTNYVGSNISKFNVTASSTEIVWIRAAESYFLRAEGALRGWNMGGDAQSFYEEGIRKSFDENGVAGADNYISSAATPTSYVDNATGANGLPAPSTVSIAWSDSDDTETKLERVITQKWIAMFLDGPEGWAEFRRTGYPVLFPVVTNRSNGAVDTDIQVCRLPYPETEYNRNAAGVASGVSKLGGSDTGGTKLWWDKK